ncbi:MAG: hypothetical protein KGL39_31140 [Patescibacteria group bacterium]|nr:hypothetical protein [Patescibacteria group bacterium]
MSHWNHRVFLDGVNVSIRETFYDDDVNIVMWDELPLIEAESVEDLRQNLKWMLDCLDKPVLREVDNGDGTFRAEVVE